MVIKPKGFLKEAFFGDELLSSSSKEPHKVLSGTCTLAPTPSGPVSRDITDIMNIYKGNNGCKGYNGCKG